MIIKIITILLITSATYGLDAEGVEYGVELGSLIFRGSMGFATVAGLAITIKSLLMMKEMSNNVNSGIKVSAVLLTMLTGSMLLSINGWIDIVSKSVLGSDTYCFYLEPGLSSSIEDECFLDLNVKNSAHVDRMRGLADKDDEETMHWRLALGYIQVLGLIYLISAILKIRKIVNSYGESINPFSPIVSIIFAVLMINIRGTMTMVAITYFMITGQPENI